MKKIKDIIIHWLGGYTATEYIGLSRKAFDKGYAVGLTEGSRKVQESFDNGYCHGYRDFFNNLMKRAGELYGCPADVWCKEMYSFIKNIRTKL